MSCSIRWIGTSTSCRKPKFFNPGEPPIENRNDPARTDENSLDHPKNLYIYYFEGRLRPDLQPAGGDFLGTWEEDGFSFLFFSKPNPHSIQWITANQPQVKLIDSYQMTYEEWMGEKFSAARIGGFFIAPPWDRKEAPAGTLPILLDPGLVFGTGTHPTTRDSLQALELVRRHDEVDSVLDLGTGTGLIALAAARLGSRRILAVDNNFLAAKTARRNVERNGLSDRILVVRGAAENFVDFPADLMVANIHHEILNRLIHSDGFVRKRWCILSGLLRSQAAEISSHLARLPIREVKAWISGGIWHTYCLKIEI